MHDIRRIARTTLTMDPRATPESAREARPPPQAPVAGAAGRRRRRRRRTPGRPPRARAVERRRSSGLRAFYGEAEQVKGIDLDFRANEVTAIIGPSGCGKSTMVRCINRMHEEIPGARAEGRVLLDDARRVRPGGRRRRRAPRDRDGLPEAQPVPDDVDLRQRRRRPAPELAARAARPTCTPRSRRAARAPGCGTRSQTGSPSPAPGCPAASSSGCASRARWRSSPR